MKNEKAKKLLNDKNNIGATPLILAVSSGDRDSVLSLLKNGANPKIASNENMSPLHFATITK